MLLGRFYEGVELFREDKLVYAHFLVPHRVISTCRADGGIQDGLAYVYNHQSCEPAGHQAALPQSAWRDPVAYRERVAGRYGLPAAACATLGTAANMANAAVVSESFRRHQVVAVATGGVECNAGRVGDPASGYEEDGEHLPLDPPPPPPAGTINTMLFIAQELTPGALVRSVVTATEAKTAALQELNVNSRYSPRLATGTGTDQIAVACRLATGTPLAGAGKHSKLGELIGRSVQAAIMQTLALQNRLTPAGQCSARIHLERFGASRERLLAGLAEELPPALHELWTKNQHELDRDPPTVAAVAALVHLHDKLAWGVLPGLCRGEVLAGQAALVAAAVSGRHERLAAYRERLAPRAAAEGPEGLLKLAIAALALGFGEKWQAEG